MDEPAGSKGGRPPLDETPEGLLRSDPRRRILRLVQKKPGSRLVDLLIEADMSAGTFYYHLGHLKRAGLVETHTSANVARAYPAGQVVPPREGPLDSEAARNVARVVLRRPGRSTDEIAEALRIAPRTVRLHLNALVQAGLVTRKTHGWSRRYEPTERLRTELKAEK